MLIEQQKRFGAGSGRPFHHRKRQVTLPWSFTIAMIFILLVTISFVAQNYSSSHLNHVAGSGLIGVLNQIQSWTAAIPFSTPLFQKMKSGVLVAQHYSNRWMVGLQQTALVSFLLQRMNFFTQSLHPTTQFKPIKDFFHIARQGYNDWSASHYQDYSPQRLLALPCEYVDLHWGDDDTTPHHDTQPTPQPIEPSSTQPEPPTTTPSATETTNEVIPPSQPHSFWDWVCSVFFPAGLDSVCPAPSTKKTPQHVVNVQSTSPTTPITVTLTNDNAQQPATQQPSSLPDQSSSTTQPIPSKYPPYAAQVHNITCASKMTMVRLAQSACHNLFQFTNYIARQRHDLTTELPIYNELSTQIERIGELYVANAEQYIVLNIIFPSFWLFVYQVYLVDLFTLFLHRTGHYFLFTLGFALGVLVGSVHTLIPVFFGKRGKGDGRCGRKHYGEHGDDTIATITDLVPNGTSGKENLETNWLYNPNQGSTSSSNDSTEDQEAATVSDNTQQKQQPHTPAIIDPDITQTVFIVQPDHSYHIAPPSRPSVENNNEQVVTTDSTLILTTTSSPKNVSTSPLDKPVLVTSLHISSSSSSSESEDSIADPNNQPITNYSGSSNGDSLSNNNSSSGDLFGSSAAIPSTLFNTSSSNNDTSCELTTIQQYQQHQQPQFINLNNSSAPRTNIGFNSSLWAHDETHSDDELETIRLNKSKLNILQSVQKSKQKMKIVDIGMAQNNDQDVPQYDLCDGE